MPYMTLLVLPALHSVSDVALEVWCLSNRKHVCSVFCLWSLPLCLHWVNRAVSRLGTAGVVVALQWLRWLRRKCKSDGNIFAIMNKTFHWAFAKMGIFFFLSLYTYQQLYYDHYTMKYWVGGLFHETIPVDMTASCNRCRFFNCTFMVWISCSSTSQRVVP